MTEKDETLDHEGTSQRDIDRSQEIIRLRTINTQLLEALGKVRWRCALAATWKEEVARRLAEDILGVLDRAAIKIAKGGD